MTGEIDPRARHERSEPGREILRSEKDLGGAIPERVLELVDRLAGDMGRN